MFVTPEIDVVAPKIMSTSPKNLRYVVLAVATVVPLSVIGILSATVLLPGLKNPESGMYSSTIGYPALQRWLGKPIKVQAIAVTQTALEEGTAAPGESVALQKVDIRPSVTGTVENVYVVEGQQVRRGQPLLRLKQEQFQIAVENAQVNLAAAETKLKTLQKTLPMIEQRLRNDFSAAKERQAIAATRFQQVQGLVEEGAVSRFRSAELEDQYITRQNERLSAEQVLVQTQGDAKGRLAEAKLAVENSKLALQDALRNLNYTTLYASTDGLVSKANIHSGEIADAATSQPLMILSQNIVFKAFIDQARLNAIKVGDRAAIRLVAYPGQVFNGRVMRLNPTVETDSTQFRSELGVDRKFTYSVWVEVEDLQMPPGLQGFVQFTKGRTSKVVPEGAVTHLSGGEGMVMVNQGGIAAVRKVRLGRVLNNQREVLEGVQPGEQVILAAKALNPGDRLEVQLAKPEHSNISLQPQATSHPN